MKTAFSFEDLIDQASNVRAGKSSDRVLSCQGVEKPIGEWAKALADKLGRRNDDGSLNVRGVMIALNTAARLNKPAFGLGAFALASGKPYADPVKRGPRKEKDKSKPTLKPVKKAG